VNADFLRKFKAQTGRFWRSQWALTLALCLSGALLLLFRGDLLEDYEMRWLDNLLRWRADIGLARQPDPHIVHLDLDTDELDKLPDVEQEYQGAAEIIDEASQLGVSVIVLDIVFARGSPDNAAPILRAIERASSRNCSVVLAEFLYKPLEFKRSFPFGQRFRPSGLANVEADSDGVLRRYGFLHPGPEGLEPSLALAAYLSWRRIDWDTVTSLSEKKTVRWSELSRDNSTLESREVSAVPAILNFRSAWDALGISSFRRYTVAQLRSLFSNRQTGDPRPSPLANSILIVSLVGPGIGDVVTTPFGSNQPGAIAHSTALNDLLQNTSIRRLPPLLEAATLCFILPFAWATRFCRRITSLFLMLIAVSFAILTVGSVLTLITNHLIGSVAIASLWAMVAIAELARRYCTLKMAVEIEKLPQKTLTPESNLLNQSADEDIVGTSFFQREVTTEERSLVRLVYSYSHRDDSLREELETHLALLKRQGVIAPWSDRKILAGEDWAGRIDERFKAADIILLLVSADFLRSNYCYEIEMQNALERHHAGTARVVPIILRDVDWHSAPFGKLQALPRDGKAITLWTNRDEAWASVARGIREMIDDLLIARRAGPSI
jgi:CHASE2 domain-containing sensor protein